MGLSKQEVSDRYRGSRSRYVRTSAALGALGVAVLAAIPSFGTRSRHHGIGVCSYEVVSRAPLWMWFVGLTSLSLANAALLYARGIRVHDTQANRILAWGLGLALVVAVAWFAWAQIWGYHNISCEY